MLRQFIAMLWRKRLARLDPCGDAVEVLHEIDSAAHREFDSFRINVLEQSFADDFQRQTENLDVGGRFDDRMINYVEIRVDVLIVCRLQMIDAPDFHRWKVNFQSGQRSLLARKGKNLVDALARSLLHLIAVGLHLRHELFP